MPRVPDRDHVVVVVNTVAVVAADITHQRHLSDAGVNHIWQKSTPFSSLLGYLGMGLDWQFLEL